jgi:hypothetical protein
MYTIDLAYAGRGLHEELVAYVADQEGYYEDEGVHVAIRDGIHWKTERLRRGATIGLGRTLLLRLTEGIGWKMLSVNTHRPLFWFLGSADVKSMADLRGRRLAVHAAHTPPGCFARIVLRKHGLDPDRDLKCVLRAPGDYQMDLRRLRAFGTAPSTPPTWAARSPPNRLSRKKGSTCWHGSAITSRSPPWASPWTQPTSRWTTPRCRRWCGPTSGPSGRLPNNPAWPSTTSLLPRPADA